RRQSRVVPHRIGPGKTFPQDGQQRFVFSPPKGAKAPLGFRDEHPAEGTVPDGELNALAVAAAAVGGWTHGQLLSYPFVQRPARPVAGLQHRLRPRRAAAQGVLKPLRPESIGSRPLYADYIAGQDGRLSDCCAQYARGKFHEAAAGAGRGARESPRGPWGSTRDRGGGSAAPKNTKTASPTGSAS